MNRTRGKRSIAPEKMRFTTARVVSNRYSIMKAGQGRARPLLDGCSPGWTNATAPRALSIFDAARCSGHFRCRVSVLNFAAVHASMTARSRLQGVATVPWLDANGISIHYQLAGEGPSLVLLHEMGGTLDSWDGLFSALSQRFRVLRYDQRGSGLSEKVRQPITTELLVADLAAVLQGLALAPPYHFVTVAAATMQALLYMTRSPEHIASFVFCKIG